MKKYSILLLTAFVLISFGFTAFATQVRFRMRESALGKRNIYENFTVEVLTPESRALICRLYTGRLGGTEQYITPYYSLAAGATYLARVLPEDTSTSSITGREIRFTVPFTTSWTKDVYLQRKDQTILNIKVVDAITPEGISNAWVEIGAGEGKSLFFTWSGGVMNPEDQLSREIINARPNDTHTYLVTKEGYVPARGSLTTPSTAGSTLNLVIPLNRRTAKRVIPRMPIPLR